MPTMNRSGAQSEIVVGPPIDGIQTRRLRPKAPPYVAVEVIDKAGNVGHQRTGTADRYWAEELLDQGRVIVAVLHGRNAEEPKDLPALRAKHGYKIGRDELGNPCIELLPGDSEIRRRRDRMAKELEIKRRQKPAKQFSGADAAAMILEGLRTGNATDGPAMREMREMMEAQQRQIQALTAKLDAQPADQPSADAEDAPAPSPRKKA